MRNRSRKQRAHTRAVIRKRAKARARWQAYKAENNRGRSVPVLMPPRRVRPIISIAPWLAKVEEAA